MVQKTEEGQQLSTIFAADDSPRWKWKYMLFRTASLPKRYALWLTLQWTSANKSGGTSALLPRWQALKNISSDSLDSFQSRDSSKFIYAYN